MTEEIDKRLRELCRLLIKEQDHKRKFLEVVTELTQLLERREQQLKLQ
jgi:hypothetical protein